MSTIQTVKTQIQSLINLANTTTGNTDTNLTDGVNALVSGYGQGGSGSSGGINTKTIISTPLRLKSALFETSLFITEG